MSGRGEKAVEAREQRTAGFVGGRGGVAQAARGGERPRIRRGTAAALHVLKYRAEGGEGHLAAAAKKGEEEQREETFGS